jgi:hypothetical protein
MLPALKSTRLAREPRKMPNAVHICPGKKRVEWMCSNESDVERKALICTVRDFQVVHKGLVAMANTHRT